MKTDQPVIAVVGAGAVGGYYGARLAQHGHNVHFLLRSDYGQVRKAGLKIKSIDGDFELGPEVIQVHNDPATMPKADLVLITLKTTANSQFKSLVSPLVQHDTAILTLQNGLGNEAQLAALFGAERILGGMAFVCINRLESGVIHHMDHGVIKIGEFAGGPSARATQIANWFNGCKVACTVLDDLNYGRWEKLIWNIPFNGLGALLDLTTDRLIDTESGRLLVKSLMQEVVDAFQAGGVAFSEDIIEQKIKHTQTMGPYRTSMQVDRQNGRPMEIEAILGEALRHAASEKVTTPFLKMLYIQLSLLETRVG